MLTNWQADHVSGMLDQVAQAIMEANKLDYCSSYGSDDEFSQRMITMIRELVADQEAEVFVVGTGTASNALALACLTQGHGAVICASEAHIVTSEANAPEFFTGGAKLVLTRTWPDGKMNLDDLELKLKTFHEEPKYPHQPPIQTISITQSTEAGALYSLDELERIYSLANQYGCNVHMDGARIANAIVAMDSVNPKHALRNMLKGLDILSFGTTKNGTMCAEVMILFSKSKQLSRTLGFLRKRGGHLLEKMRFYAAQVIGYLDHDEWLKAARNANQQAAYLAKKLPPSIVTITQPVITNMVYIEVPRDVFERVSKHHSMSLTAGSAAARGKPSKPENVRLRLVTSWKTEAKDVEMLASNIFDVNKN